MEPDKIDQTLMSLRVSKVLDDIGVTKQIVSRRRKTWLLKETVKTFRSKLMNSQVIVHHVGSQSEGTTTLGMRSDIDMLLQKAIYKVILDYSDWEFGKGNLLLLRNESMPPQHCYLQRLRHDCPIPKREKIQEDDFVDNEGRVLVRNTENDAGLGALCDDITRHGPALTIDECVDLVCAYICKKPPADCMYIYRRPRSGHWPRPETLAAAKLCPAFLVPQGYPDSDHRTLEWRMSTSLVERLLMFDFSRVQIKTYVLLKMIRKSILKPIVGDNLSTFHLKTAMMFTIESYPPNVWREDKIIQCAIYCLTTLLGWMKIGYCPHYTIAGVNLFVGKFNKWQLEHCSNIISEIINHNLKCIEWVELDSLGERLIDHQTPRQRNECSFSKRSQNLQHIAGNLLYNIFTDICGIYKEILVIINTSSLENCLKQLLDFKNYLTLTIHQEGSQTEKEVAGFLISFISGTCASIIASTCIQGGIPVPLQVLELYNVSVDSDLLSNRLKFASMLFCSGQYEAAANCLTFCEGLLVPEVWPLCNCQNKKTIKPNNEYMIKALEHSYSYMMQKLTACCVKFSHMEMYCVPKHLVYEMFKKYITDGAIQGPYGCRKLIEMASIDSVPFLYYMQYLTYRQLNQPARKVRALQNLWDYTSDPRCSYGHTETVANVLGQCLELENRPDIAWICYKESLRVHPHENVAIWHLMRILNEIIHEY